MYSALRDVDDSDYLAHVIHGLAYAAKGHWYATLALCRTAVAVRDCIPKEARGHRLGREACYLAAVAMQRQAIGVKDLREAKDWLDRARNRDEDRPRDSRFDSEELALDAMEHYFGYFRDKKVLNVEAVWSTCLALVRLIDWVEAEQDEESVKNWVLRQCLTNFFSLRVLLRQLEAEGSRPVEAQDRIFLSRCSGPQTSGLRPTNIAISSPD